MIYPPTFDPSKGYITDSGRVFQALKADGSYDDAATAATYALWARGACAITDGTELVTALGVVANCATGSMVDSTETPKATGKITTVLGLI